DSGGREDASPGCAGAGRQNEERVHEAEMKRALALLFALVACNGDSPNAVLCKDIPPGGCPLSHGVACDDPACVAAYACLDGKWSLDHVCPARDAGADATLDASDARDARAMRDVGFDVPPGASGGP